MMQSIENTSDPPQEKLLTVYVTGFGSFQRLDKNPSGIIAASFLSDSSTIRFVISGITYTVRILAHPEPIKVAYASIDYVTQQLWGRNDWHYMLHLGAAVQPNVYRLEKLAHDRGYNKKDVDGRIPDIDQHLGVSAINYISEESTNPGDRLNLNCGKILATALDLGFLCDYVKSYGKNCRPDGSEWQNFDIKPSEDAGMYICEYIYRGSLLEAQKRGQDAAKRVLFMHVPPDSSEDCIKVGRLVVIRLIEAIVRNGENLSTKTPSINMQL